MKLNLNLLLSISLLFVLSIHAVDAASEFLAPVAQKHLDTYCKHLGNSCSSFEDCEYKFTQSRCCYQGSCYRASSMTTSSWADLLSLAWSWSFDNNLESHQLDSLTQRLVPDLEQPSHGRAISESGKNPYERNMETYLNVPDVMSHMGAMMDSAANSAYAHDWMRPYVDEIAPLLEDGIRILIYAGDADFTCNWMGNKAWVIGLPWSGHEEFAAAEDTPWFSTTANEQGGHVVPMDRGDYAIDMLNNWLHEELV
ncbi:hypothetical protein O0I10_010698 [Lichtheimia ornata]|uniref:Serine carboxypeptidase n=1 Tax=Lichtheimia ornata TaxID=688661 RepID=A0AAD7XTB2_9FUNG|nr:uncharacterized protein O0I10_010698 [Lichtheimia ornata]KAJ8653660.1 hypothetical protein O0I10_010698 [Lichtheimia ornata]